MRYLGIDHGQKRIGLALSDADGRMAFPLRAVSTIEEIVVVARERGAEAVVIGLPLAADGGETEQSRIVRRFAVELQNKLPLPIAFAAERYTTKIAERSSSPEVADASAAALILQGHLDKTNAER